MADKSRLSTVLQIEVQNGVDDNGNARYKKKSFNRIKEAATPDAIQTVGQALATVIKPTVEGFFIQEDYVLA